MKADKKILPWLGFGGSLLLIVAALIGFRLYNFYGARNANTYDMAVNRPAATRGIGLNVVISKNWVDETHHEQMPVGAQYDMEIVNHTDKVLTDWTLSVELPQTALVDSGWNGEFRAEDHRLIVDCVDYNTEIEPGEKITLGAVLYTPSLFMPSGAEISCRVAVNYLHSPIFWGLISALAVCVIALVIYMIFRRRTQKYIERQKRDSEIILQAMNTFAGLIDSKDPYTSGHSTRVAIYSSEISRRMGMSEDEVQTMYYIALMHDCGKIGIPDYILTKPGKLTDGERKIIQSHTVVGGSVLEHFTAIPEIRLGALYHHERYDGNGYPEGLKRDAIPLCARIICVADSYDAMSSKRCYRASLPKEAILKELRDNAGEQFDPKIVQYMIDMIQDGFTDPYSEKESR